MPDNTIRLSVVCDCQSCGQIHEWIEGVRIFPPDKDGRDLWFVCPVTGKRVKAREVKGKGQ